MEKNSINIKGRMDLHSFYENDVLFGHNKNKQIVSCEITKEENIQLFFRRNGKVFSEIHKLKPFLFLNDLKYLKEWEGNIKTKPLKGDEYYKHIVFVDKWSEFLELTKFLKRITGYSVGSFLSPYYFMNDPVLQYLLITGQTFFKGMEFRNLVRLQLDIETYCKEGYEFSNPKRVEDCIIIISMSDTLGWERVISGKDFSEKNMLQEMVNEICKRDPDIIEGHNIFNFDFKYIKERARRHKVPLNLGRNGATMSSRNSRFSIAERNISYTRFDIFGRHVVDTMHLAQMYDVTSRSLESYGLKSIAKHFNVAPPDRTYVDAGKMNELYDNNIETLLRYALDDVKETKAISNILCQSFFYQCQIFPYAFQNVIVRGNATKIDTLFLREYIREECSFPRPTSSKDVVGGYTDIFQTGLINNVVHCDVQSLYPSIMLAFKYVPRNDSLGIFPLLLKELKDFRFQAKELKNTATSKDEETFFEAIQSTFKILINSFYGYLGFSFGHFSDFEAANNVTTKGRELIKEMVAWLEEKSCNVIEIDTDGIYFVPPDSVKSGQEEDQLISELSSALPEGINIELAGRYKAMFSYKMKNYVLLDYDGKMTIKGSGLKSRGLELFQRRFMEEMFKLLLNDKAAQIDELLNKYIDHIVNHDWDKEMFIKKDTLQESLEVYTEKLKIKKRPRAAAYELALKADRNYQAGDMVSYYVTGDKKRVTVFENSKLASLWNNKNPDENVEYYKNKLLELYKKFQPFFDNK
ncbi:MAG: DNA polymerase domain-containing protein [Candidatus Anammoxibacter sp.]